MQKEKKSECPLDTWMNAKICLPEGNRGFAVGKIVQESDRSNSLVLSLDPSFLGDKSDLVEGAVKWNSSMLSSQSNLSSLPKGTAVLLAPPKIFGVKFWIVRIDQLNKVIGNSKENISQNAVSYSLHELKKLKNFLEARSSQRVAFRTPVLFVDPKNYTVTQYYTHDISQSGLSIAIDIGSSQEESFETGENYLLQLKLHEGITMPALNYKCIHKREDILTGAKLVGFQLNDRKAKDPDVEYNLTLLTWSDDKEEH
ncbi:MAG: PilZ domain-containing protein [Candidatus Caenarcaniphilales bacterium]|nr:PilZ domain-containing protein [Candidatus Caenarcaniphilales bacterium]